MLRSGPVRWGMAAPSPRRLAFIGLDAVEPELAERLMTQGAMPRLAALRRRGQYGRLVSESTWRSGRVWETLLCGQADFPSASLFDPDTYTPWQLGSRRKPPFYASIPGAEVVALDVPYMSLWYDVPGAQVIWGGHDAGYPRASRPAGLVRDLDALLGVHPTFHNDFNCAWWHPPSVESLTSGLFTGSRRRTDALGHLLRRVPHWNLLMTVLSEGHSAGEMFWHGLASPDHPLARTPTADLCRDRLIDVYRELDAALGRILDLLPADAAVMVASVHGMELNHYDVPSMALLPELLYRANFNRARLRTASPRAIRRWQNAGCPPIIPAAHHQWDDWIRLRFGPQSLSTRWREFRIARGWRRPARRIEDLAVPIPPEDPRPPEAIDEPRWELTWQPTVWYRDAWPRMRAFAAPLFYDGRVRINLAGRDRDGIVTPDDYPAALAWVESLLLACRDLRSGRPAVESITRLRQSDALAKSGPDADLLITWNPGVDAIAHPELGVIGPVPFRRTGGHTSRGFACLAGPGIGPAEVPQREALGLTAELADLLRVAICGAGPAADPAGVLAAASR